MKGVAVTLGLMTLNLLIVMPAVAQTPEEEVTSVVDALFDAMRAGDSTAVRSVFTPDAQLHSTGVREGEPYRRTIPADRFVEAVGTPHEETWDEKIWDVEVRVDDPLATVYTRFAFYLGDEFSHCGVNAFHLHRTAEGWKIFHVADTRREDRCGMGSEQ